MDKIRVNMKDILLCLSNAQDIISPVVSRHHQQVAYLSLRLAEQLSVPLHEREDIFLAAIVHDIGALSMAEKLEIVESETGEAIRHAFRGARLFGGFGPMKTAAEIIRYHHLPWDNGGGRVSMGGEVPMGSHIIHLADRVCARFRPEPSPLSQLPPILAGVRERSGSHFVPDYVDALETLAEKEYIWLDLMSREPVRRLPMSIMNEITLEIDDVIDLAEIFSQIIDFRSKFTSRHSAGVARTAEKLAQLVGFSPNECRLMLVAGYLHDLGKLAVNTAILEKADKLSLDETNEMRAHTYFTYHLLNVIPQFHEINQWAAFHHEKLDGTGYPFRLKGDGLPLGSRVMAVADVFTAITENRPYRVGMDDARAVRVLRGMAEGGALDGKIVGLLIDNFSEIVDLRNEAQARAAERYDQFFAEG